MTSWIMHGGAAGEWEQYALNGGVAAVGGPLNDLAEVESVGDLQALVGASGVEVRTNLTAMLWSLLREVHRGDIVVMPRRGSDVVAVGEVTGDYRYAPGGHPEARHVRDVDWLDAEVAKTRFAADLRAYFDLPPTLTSVGKVRNPDGRLRTAATSDLPDGYEPDGPLAEFPPPVAFVLDQLPDIPQVPSVHLVWSPDGELLYVGYTGRPLRERLYEHLRGDRQASILNQRVAELLDARREQPATGEDIERYLTGCTLSWATADDPEEFKERLIELLSPRFAGKSAGPNCWWVNQGQTYSEERELGVMWAPVQNQHGRTYRHWSALKQTRPGDRVYHYAGGVIRALGIVTKPAREAPKPFAAEAWETDGYLVDVEYVDLETRIALNDIPLEWRTSESGGPFDVNGAVKQGYLFPVSESFARQLAARFPVVASRLPPPEPKRRVWLFQGNPERWPIDTMLKEARIGEIATWSVSQHKHDIREGHLMLLWMAGPAAGIYAVTELVTDPYQAEQPDEFGDTKVDFRWLELLDTPLTRDMLEANPVLRDLHVLRFRQATNYPVTAMQWEALEELIGWQEPQPLTIDWLEDQTLWERDRLESLVSTLTDETYQVVLAGPPGTGKTHVARLVARYVTGDTVGAQRIVQFHPSYSYEEFIEGLRPVADQGAVEFRVESGVVVKMCHHIDPHADQLHVLVIDEMNRANLSSVFGELMYLFEYRDQEIDLRFTPRFALPSTLRFIGTMNTADRSARSIDIALRRRFDVFECPPDREILERYYKKSVKTNHVPSLLEGFELLNAQLTELRDRHHTIGHTFFMADDFTVDRLRHVWEHKIMPLLEEYFLDQPDQVASFQIGTFWPEAAP